MKSVGEIMALGRNFPEALQKAIRMLALHSEGILDSPIPFQNTEELKMHIEIASPRRLFAIAKALHEGIFSLEEIFHMTKIDPWFLSQIKRITDMAHEITKKKLDAELLRNAKTLGFSDREIAHLTGKKPEEVRKLRKTFGIIPCVKQIDTLAAEFPAQTNYLYTSYVGAKDDISLSSRA
jgi:hypothetical protein